jgi:hypothetical protein
MLETEISLRTAASPQQKCTRAGKNEFIKKIVLVVHSVCSIVVDDRGEASEKGWTFFI